MNVATPVVPVIFFEFDLDRKIASPTLDTYPYVLHVGSNMRVYTVDVCASDHRTPSRGELLCFCGPRDPVFFKLKCNTFRGLIQRLIIQHPASNNPASPLAHEAYNVSMRGRPDPIGRASIRSNDGGSARISHTTSHGIHGAALKCG